MKMDTKSRTARETLIYEALRFANWAAGEGICPVEGENAKAPEDFLMEFSNATNDEDWDTLADRLSTLPSAAVAEREPVAQFRKVGCSDWYDGLPDHEDGRGPYEERTLYLDPPPTSELEAENARLQARVAELDKAVFDIQIMSVASAACFTNAQLENILTKIERAACRVREGGKEDG